jgi:integration host factor subunit beta
MSNECIQVKKSITKKKLIKLVAEEVNISFEEAEVIFLAFLEKVTESLAKGERLEFRDFGVFEVIRRKQKIGRNPKRAEVAIVIPARLAVKFTPGKKMNESVSRI